MLEISVLTEHQQNPIIGVKRPRFGWKFKSGSGLRQKSYRILVASSEDMLLRNEADLWDTGIVNSDQMLDVEYGGKELKSRQVCHFKVIVWAEDQTAEQIGRFETALFEEDDWKGRWVGIPVSFNGGSLYFRKVLNIDREKEVKRARVYLCGLGYHELFINGKKVADCVLNPGVTDFSKRLFYCAYDIGPFLEKEDNVLGVELGYGWYGSRMMLLQLYVEYRDGTEYEDHSAPVHGWWVSGSPNIYNSVYGGEEYDARMEDKYPKNWATREFKPSWDNGWMYAIAVQRPTGKLELQSIEPIRIKADFPEVSRAKKAENVYVCDIGQNISGWAKIRVSGERGSKVILKFGEDLTDDGYVNQANLRSARNTDIYILKGSGVEEYEPKFTYHGFRYVQAEIEGKAELIEIVGRYVHSDVKKVGEFECSDPVLNKLHKNAVMTEYNNLHSIMTDCPQRDERFGWINDLGSRLFQNVYNCDMSRLYEKVIRDITHTQDENYAIADTAPYYTGGRPADPVSVAYLLLATFSYRYYGNSRPARREYENLKGWTDYLLSRANNYILEYSYYGDWVSPACFEDAGADHVFVSSSYLYWHLLEMAKIAKIAGRDEDRQKYLAHAAKAREAINGRFFDASSCNYCGGRQSENAIALSLKLVPDEYISLVAENLYESVKRRNYHSTCGNVGYRHLFYALADNGYADAVIKILKNPEYPGWGYMIACGATTVWERWEKEMQVEMHSFNHPMFGSYDAWFYAYLGGIKVDEDSFGADRITVKPHVPEGLDFVNCKFETVRGTVVSNWKKEGDKVLYHIEVPPNTTAKIILGDMIKEVGEGVYRFSI